ncbi:hypothetical protein [Streptomyces sp. NPDC056549]|uniref:hypothetical protein n=1 Tax=Streptomyces sp. NPDC056549 TaxID=3345864 RepID=UPI0036B8DA04
MPIGSVVDIQLAHRKLRVHLNREVAPDREAEHEPVLGMSVPVDSDTLIDRCYVHRIRLESHGTTRHVQIGTEAFARRIEWFSLEECEITDRGLSTPAVERIVQDRRAPSSAVWIPGQKQQESEQDVHAHELLRRLLYARRTESTDLAEEVCTRAYVTRRTKEGLNKKDIMRCLKRFVAREVYRALTSTPTERITQTDLAPAA